MHVPLVYAVCAAALLMAARAAPTSDADDTGDQQDSLTVPETFPYLMPRFTSRFRPALQWNGLTDQDIFLEANRLAEQEPEERFKRQGNVPSLSIINPLDVLRQRLLLEMARRKMRENEKQVVENRKLMKTIGKRGSFLRQPNQRHAYDSPLGYDTM